MAAILMARTAIEAVCKDKGIVKGNLFEKIGNLKDSGHIRAHIEVAAHAVRAFGNDMAHGDITLQVDEEEARLCLKVLDAILAEVYDIYVLTDQVQSAVEERKAGAKQQGTA